MGPEGPFLINGDQKIRLRQRREDEADLRQIAETQSIARNFLALTDPGSLRIASLAEGATPPPGLPPELEARAPPAALARRTQPGLPAGPHGRARGRGPPLPRAPGARPRERPGRAGRRGRRRRPAACRAPARDAARRVAARRVPRSRAPPGAPDGSGVAGTTVRGAPEHGALPGASGDPATAARAGGLQAVARSCGVGPTRRRGASPLDTVTRRATCAGTPSPGPPG